MDPFTAALILATATLLIYLYLWKPMKYLEQMGIPHEPWFPILGNMGPIMFRRVHFAEHFQTMYNRFPDAKYFGVYSFIKPTIVLRDPDLIASITIKNFDNFTDHDSFTDEKVEPLLGRNLVALKGDRWREMRKVLRPAFTSSKMKIMFNLIVDCADNFTKHIAKQSKQGKVFDLKDSFGRYTNDVIATTSFGITVDSMENPENEFFMFAKQIVQAFSTQMLKVMVIRNFSRLARFLGLKLFSDETRRYFTNVVAETIKTRKEKGIYRPDMIQLMIESRHADGQELNIDKITSQAFFFFLAGYEASSTLLSFAAHEIAVNPDVQARLRAEIEDVMKATNGKPTYDAVNNMKYMSAVINEAGRLYPAAVALDRLCVKEFVLPPATENSKPVTMKPGDVVWIIPFTLHRDQKYFPEPKRFDPDRFLAKEIPQNVFVPFGIGPRICIANRFALMEAKIALIYLLLRCDIEPCAQTTIRMKFSTKTFSMVPENGFWLRYKTRENGNA
ncbi:cytochrome P450 9e2-like [Hylaeus anthracinus]|uniref:cytochrome P450 9e2-like n=1 Tax=Hylaeus anthracinus TaxID=313031 RepID=UPI0023B9ABF5|nr:cytochrome P450 9e2-like [Hylaeus anthracinus]